MTSAALCGRAATVKELLKPRSVLVVLGSGGVGKTTIAAALGVAAATAHLRTAVITVDPARRLRDALGLPRLGGKPTRIDARRLRAAGLNPALKLSAMVLDVKGEWDAMVAEHVTDPAIRRRILDNAFYQSLSTRFAGSDAYAALEALHHLHVAGHFDLEVVDTPPAAHAFEFVQAPARLMRLLDSQAARWLLKPAGRPASLALRLAGRLTSYVARELERFAGGDTLSSIADFFAAAAGAAERIAARMQTVASLLRSPAVRFVLVTTAEPDRLRQARRLIDKMESEGLHLGAIVINRFLDEAIRGGGLARGGKNASGPGGRILDHGSGQVLDHALDHALGEISALRAALDAEGAGDDGVTAVLAYLENYRRRSEEDIRRVRRFVDGVPARVKVALAPEIRPGTPSLAALARLANFLVTPQAMVARPARGANSAAAPKGRAPLKGGRRAGEKSDGGVGRMPE
ncbi:MAG TPA: ArsA-related P-loop ATPase [Candidatus Binataceae bacterium]|nr:ArsA-related P-loop ATPase [Candidatus Binataceae bacterium]